MSIQNISLSAKYFGISAKITYPLATTPAFFHVCLRKQELLQEDMLF